MELALIGEAKSIGLVVKALFTRLRPDGTTAARAIVRIRSAIARK